jgi:hypothetical protein
MLITYDKNFKAKRLTQKKILTIYRHVSFWETIVKTVSLLQLWHPPKGWKIAYLPWNFWHNMLFMIKKFMPNFKVKKFIQKKIFTIYQRVCPPFASITACNLEGIEWHSWRSFVPLINLHSFSITTFKSSKFFGHIGPCCTTSFKIFQRFSIELRSREFAG